jgi:hypothetical protein
VSLVGQLSWSRRACAGWSLEHFLRDASLGALVGLLLAPPLQWASAAAVRRWGNEVYDNLVLRAIVPANRGEWVAVALALLPAAFLEELIFRSLPLAGLSWLISPWVLMWPLALLFRAASLAAGTARGSRHDLPRPDPQRALPLDRQHLDRRLCALGAQPGRSHPGVAARVAPASRRLTG